MRPLAASGAIALLTATLLWGGCLSCPQFFMVGQSKQSCCDSDGKCRRTPAKQEQTQECRKMPFSHPEQAASGIALPAAVLVSTVFLSDVITEQHLVEAPKPVEHSPPDLLALNATLLI